MSMAWFVLLLLALYVASLFGKGRFAAFTPDKTQPLRGILAVLIVAHHLSHIAPADAVLTPVYSWSASLVSLFFFISGFGLTRQLASRGQSYLSGFFARRIVRGILVSWLLAYVLFLLLGGNQAWNPADAVLGLLATGNTTLPYSWYVLCILYLYVGFYLCARFVPGRWMAPALAVWTLAGMTAVGLAVGSGAGICPLWLSPPELFTPVTRRRFWLSSGAVHGPTVWPCPYCSSWPEHSSC